MESNMLCVEVDLWEAGICTPGEVTFMYERR